MALFQLDDEPNLCIKNGCFTKHLFEAGCLGFQEAISIFLRAFEL